jgi:hypothetical protein
MHPETAMRYRIAAAALSISLLAPLGAWADTAPGPAAGAPGANAAMPNADAAAKHAKRTACRKQAKDKKLVGADKNTFIKNCLAAP